MQKNKEPWPYELYERAILNTYKSGLDDGMKLALLTFITSDESISLYYETSRKIIYRVPFFWVRFTTKKRVNELLKDTAIKNVAFIIAQKLLESSTRAAVRGDGIKKIFNKFTEHSS